MLDAIMNFDLIFSNIFWAFDEWYRGRSLASLALGDSTWDNEIIGVLDNKISDRIILS